MKVTIANVTFELTPEQKEDLIKQLEKPDKNDPLFYDELGNDVFVGDVCYWVDSCMNVWDGICDHQSGKNQTIVYFKHRSDAVAYIELNKPKWSEQDVMSALHSWGEVFVDNVIRNLKNYKP